MIIAMVNLMLGMILVDVVMIEIMKLLLTKKVMVVMMTWCPPKPERGQMMLILGAGEEPWMTSMMWSVLEMWKLGRGG